MVSGSADCSIKLWRLSTGELLKTLPNQSHWVLTSIICHPANHSVPRFRGRHLMLTMTRDDIQLWSWERLDDLVQADLYIPLKSVTEAIQSFFFTPGLHFDGARISFIRQMPMFDTQTIGDADIVILSAETGKVERSGSREPEDQKTSGNWRPICNPTPSLPGLQIQEHGCGGSGPRPDRWGCNSSSQ